MKFKERFFFKLNYGFKNQLKFENKIYTFDKNSFTEVSEELYKLYYNDTRDYTCVFQGANCPVKINVYITKVEKEAVEDEEQLGEHNEGTNKLNLAIDSMSNTEELATEQTDNKPRGNTRRVKNRKIK